MGLIGIKDNTIRPISFADMVQVDTCRLMMSDSEAEALYKACPLPDHLSLDQYPWSPWSDVKSFLKETIKTAFQGALRKWSENNEEASMKLAKALIKFVQGDAYSLNYRELGAKPKMISPGGWWPLDRDGLVRVLEINKSIGKNIEAIFINNVYKELDTLWPGVKRYLVHIRLGERKDDPPIIEFNGRTRWEMDGSEKFMYFSNLTVKADIQGVASLGMSGRNGVREMSLAAMFIDVIDELNTMAQWDL